jgi:hypothetical protein
MLVIGFQLNFMMHLKFQVFQLELFLALLEPFINRVQLLQIKHLLFKMNKVELLNL